MGGSAARENPKVAARHVVRSLPPGPARVPFLSCVLWPPRAAVLACAAPGHGADLGACGSPTCRYEVEQAAGQGDTRFPRNAAVHAPPSSRERVTAVS